LNFIWDKITEWLKGLLVSGIISNLSGLFDAINTRVGEAAAVVGTTPQAWHGGIFQMIRSLSENVVVPIAGIIQQNHLRHIRFHDLRHSSASLLLANHVPLKQIQEWLGHSDFSTTANIYAHLDVASKQNTAEAMLHGLGLEEE